MNIRKMTALLICLALLLAGCGASSKQSVMRSEMAETWAAAEAADSANMSLMNTGSTAEAGSGSTGSSLPENRKFIIDMNISAETEDLEASLEAVDQRLAAAGGYMEDQSIRNGSASSARRYRSANMTLRIPVDQLDAFMETLGGLVNVVTSSRSTTDVTLQYVDTESRITALKTEQTRLLELLAKAENMSDLLEIEERLTEVRYELEQYSSQLRLLDNQIDYATVYLSLSEVKEYTPVEEKTRLETIRDGFLTSLKDLGEGILDFISAILIDLPYIVVFGGVLWGLTAFLRRKLRKRKAGKQEKQKPEKEENTES